MASGQDSSGSFGESTLKRLLLVVCSWICSIGTSGAVFGFSSLRPILEDSGVFDDLCLSDKAGQTGSDCQQQNLELALMFTLASTAVNTASFPVGFFLDRFGPRATMASGSTIFAVGCALFSAARQLSDDLYILAYMMLAVGGTGVFLSTLHLSCAFPRYSNFIMAAMTSSFDISTIVFFIFNQIYFDERNIASNSPASSASTLKRIGVSELFVIYLIVPALAFICALTLMPKTPYEIKDEAVMSTSSANLGNFVLTEIEMQPSPKATVETVTSKAVDASTQELIQRPFKYQIKTVTFLVLAVFMCCYMLRLNFYIGNVEGQLRYFIKDSMALTNAINTFGIILPVGPLISIFITSALMMLPLEFCYTILALLQIVFSVVTIGFPGNLGLQKYGAFLLLVVMRAMTFTFCNKYVAGFFGFKTFGKIYGLIMLIAGLFSILQYLFVYLAVTVWGGDFTTVNLIMCFLCVAASVLLIGFLFMRRRRNQISGQHINESSSSQNHAHDGNENHI